MYYRRTMSDTAIKITNLTKIYKLDTIIINYKKLKGIYYD